MNHPDWQALCIFLETRLAATRALARMSFRAYKDIFRLPAFQRGVRCRCGAMDGKEAEKTVTRASALLGLLVFLCVSMPLLSLLSGFVPDREGTEMRRTVNTRALVLHPEDRTPDGSRTGTDGGWFYRNAISREERGTVRHAKSTARGALVAFTKNGIALLTAAGARTLEPAADEATLDARALDEDRLFAATPPAHYGEALDAAGQPLRWVAARTPDTRVALSCLPPQPEQKRAPPQLAALPEQARDGVPLFSRAQRYKTLVERFAERYKIQTALIYAIIHNESNFQPGTVSNRRAMGLMQLLPSTAGGEVHKYLHGRTSDLDDEALMNPENNLRYGITYLHLLLTRHFGEVAHPESREFCAIAAYNLGPNALLNAFSRDRDEAIATINSLSPQEVYERLAQDLPVRETRNFIARVLNSKKEFTDFQ